MKKVAIFMDGANSFYTQKKMGWQIDAEKLLNYCKECGDVVEAIYYSGENDDSKQRSFLNKLAYIGYSLETKPVKTIRDYETGETSQKANLDVEIVLDMFNMIDRYDMAILISGTPGLVVYLPVMIGISIVTGCFTGLCAQFLVNRRALWNITSK